ncbi:MAG: hypothetical protein GX639_03855 [Fibrobacter sp.]|nr:hypothetical protein [Fibrobacter sp.]
MKIAVTIVCITFFLVGCSEFPTEFGNVQKDEYRVLDFIYEPAEAAPGDTVHVKAVFAGKKITPADIDWKISYNVVTNMYGSTDTAFDFRPFTVSETKFSNATTCMEWSFVVPDDILYTSGGIPTDWLSLVPSEFRGEIPSGYQLLTKKQMIDTMSALAAVNPQILQLVADANPGLADIVPFMCQFLTVKIRVNGQIRNDYLIESDYSVRYNRVFEDAPALGVKVNRNPEIDSLGIYKVKGNVDEFDSTNRDYTFYRIDKIDNQNQVIKIEKDYTYFVEVFTNFPDSSRTLLDLQRGTMKPEKYFTQWFFAMDSSESKGVNYTKFMGIGGDELREILIPPASGDIKNFTVWAQVYDDFANEMNRPMGSMLIEGHGVFEFTKEYLEQFK